VDGSARAWDLRKPAWPYYPKLFIDRSVPRRKSSQLPDSESSAEPLDCVDAFGSEEGLIGRVAEADAQLPLLRPAASPRDVRHASTRGLRCFLYLFGLCMFRPFTE
jgi:hypothetical protein